MKPSLADRLRAAVTGSAVPRVHPEAGIAPPLASAFDARLGGLPRLGDLGAGSGSERTVRARHAAATLGGVLEERVEGLCIVVDRYYEPEARHGLLRIGDIVAMLHRGEDGVTTLRRAWPAARQIEADATRAVEGLCAIDLETTGLAGGAGTQAFLVGCARLDGEGIHVRQFLSPGFEWERAQLSAVAEWMGDRTHLVTFNGRTFDVPLLEMRFAFNRLAWPWSHVPHLDALHPARRFWRERSELSGPDPDDARCTLGVLERRLAGVHRVGDVPGFEIPTRFFQFARDGRAEPLEAVLEHNRLDLISTLMVCARAAALVVGGPSAAERGHECLGLGRVFERLNDEASAESCFARAAAEARGVGDAWLRAEALRRLAYLQRRTGRPAEAAASWTALLGTRGVSPRLRREAREALAIHHEHRVRDLDTARTLVLAALAEPLDGRHRTNAERRLARLDRKLTARVPGALLPRFDEDPF